MIDGEYDLNGEGSYTIEAQIGGGGGGGALCFDATTNLGSWGRYINHSPQSEANIQASMVRGKWRIAFLATPHIAAGEELQYSILLSKTRGSQWKRGGGGGRGV